jgi:hypothetical protein
LGIEILDYLILVIKNWFENVHVGCNGAYKPKSVIDFHTLEFTIIEENNKFIEEWGLFEEDPNLNL